MAVTAITRMLERLEGRASSPWWPLLGVTVAAVALGAASALGSYRVVTQALRPVTAPPVLVSVVRASMPQTLTATGISFARAQARLSFSTAAATTGGVVQSVEVELGQRVSAGQPLVVLDSRAASRAVEQSTATLEAERIALTQAAAMAPSDVAAAAQGVAAASAGLQRALNDRTTLRRGAGADAIASASQAMLTAQNTLVEAEKELDALEGRARALVTSEDLQRRIDATNAQLSAAESDIEVQLAAAGSSAAFLQPPARDLAQAIEERCKDLGNRDPCVEAASGARDLGGLVAALNSGTHGNRDLGALASAWTNAVRGASASALEGAVFRQLQALAQRPGLDARHNAAVFSVTPYGSPTPAELLSATRARDAARSAVDSAQERLRTLGAGPTREEQGSADAGVSAAQAALDAAVAAQGATAGGGTAVAMQQQRVLLAQTALQRTRDALDDTVLRAPFAGVVGAVSARVGDGVVPGVPLVTVADPEGIAVRLALSEAEIGQVSEGQLGVARFDATPDLVYPVVVSGVGRVPSASTGPATYEVQVRVLADSELVEAVTRLGALVPLPAGTDPRAASDQLAHQPRPIAGLAASVTLAGVERAGVLVVPSSAVRRDSTRPTVLVSDASGGVIERVVRLGATDGTRIEILSGLTEGERVVQDRAVRP